METSSVSSIASISNSSARSTPVSNPGTYKPITPSASLQAISNSSDDEMRRRNPDELLQIIRRLESENRNVITDVNKRIQILLLEVHGLKDINQNLHDDNQELRDLCCFLDDDRQRGRKLAREWQRFGRYTASVMRSEVSAYQEKLKELETKQQELISDNLDLKELCLYLDQERLRASQPRDEGDGSSSSTIPGNEDPVQNDIELVPHDQLKTTGVTTNTDHGTNSYVQHHGDTVDSGNRTTTGVAAIQRSVPDGTQAVERGGGNKGPSPNKPEAVVHAMKVLEVHENLEKPQMTVSGENSLDDKEKAIVREMCNVVWRKLGNVKAERQEAQQANHPPVYENLKPVPGKGMQPDGHKEPSPSNARMGGYQTSPEQTSQSSGTDADSSVMPKPYIQRSDRRGHTVFQVAPSQPPDVDHHAQYLMGTQRPPPSWNNQGQPMQTPGGQYVQGGYGQVQTARATPVMPTPQKQSQKMEPRSHSPGPARPSHTPVSHAKMNNPEPNQMPYYSSSKPQSYSPSPHAYQNERPKTSGNKSYDSKPSNHNYSNFPPQSVYQSHNHSPQGTYISDGDYPTHNASSPNYHNEYPPNYIKKGRPSESNQSFQGHRSDAKSHSPPYYQNMPPRSESARDPHDYHYTSGNESTQGMPPYPSYRNPPSSSSSSHQPSYTSHSGQPHSAYTPRSANFRPIPPEYNAPPQYNDKWANNRNNDQSY
ncbi:Coiled-coil domain-containing protein 85C [Mactra antiquata]